MIAKQIHSSNHDVNIAKNIIRNITNSDNTKLFNAILSRKRYENFLNKRISFIENQQRELNSNL